MTNFVINQFIYGAFTISPPEIFHDAAHDVIAFAIDLERRGVVLGRPLEIDDDDARPLSLLALHVPQARVFPENLETGPDADDEIGLAGVSGRGWPVMRRQRFRGTLFPEVHDGVF